MNFVIGVLHNKVAGFPQGHNQKHPEFLSAPDVYKDH
jgi:hypothetical protein